MKHHRQTLLILFIIIISLICIFIHCIEPIDIQNKDEIHLLNGCTLFIDSLCTETLSSHQIYYTDDKVFITLKTTSFPFIQSISILTSNQQSDTLFDTTILKGSIDDETIFFGNFFLPRPVDTTDTQSIKFTVVTVDSDTADTAFLFYLQGNKPSILNNKAINISANPFVSNSISLYIKGQGTDSLSFQWYKDSKLLQGIYIDTLYISRLTLKDNGNYQCIVSNPWGIDSSTFYTLDVYNDTIKPIINVEFPFRNAHFTTPLNIPIYGTVYDFESGIDKITVNGTLIPYDSTTSEWGTTINLPNIGLNEVRIDAFDKLGNHSTLNLSLYYDHTNESSISGFVKDYASKLGINGVDIITSPTQFFTTTDAAGYFILRSITPNIYNITFKKTGYSDTTIISIPVTANAQLPYTNVFLRKIPVGYVKGIVCDSTTLKPLKNVKIFVSPSNEISSANEKGIFIISLIPGQYSLRTMEKYISQSIDHVFIIASDTTYVDTLWAQKARVKPMVLSGKLIGNTTKVNSLTAMVTGNSIDPQNPLTTVLDWLPQSKSFTGSFLIPNTGSQWSVAIKVFDIDKCMIGYTSSIFAENSPTPLIISPFNAENAKPIVYSDPGIDSMVSINDSIHLSGYAIDSFSFAGPIINPFEPPILKWEWSIEGTAFVQTTSSDTTIIAPGNPDSSFSCMVRITDTDGNSAIHATNIMVIQDAPIVTATAVKDTVTINDSIFLTASVVNLFGKITQWKWAFNDTLFTATSTSDTFFIAPEFTQPCTAFVQVTDDDGNSAVDIVPITIINSPPVVSIGQNVTVGIKDTVLLHGSATDNGTIVQYAWKIGRSDWLITSSSDTVIHAPSIATTLICSLRVIDDDGETGKDALVITTQQSPPTANAGADTTVGLNDTIFLHGTGTDNGYIAKWEWKFGNGFWTQTSSGDTIIFAPPTSKNYICSLKVTDDDNEVDYDTVNITVVSSPPKVDAGADTTVGMNDTIHLHGSGFDTDGSIKQYSWKFWGNIWKITSTGDTAIIAPITAGTYICSLKVVDDDNEVNFDAVKITVISSPPEANAGSDTTVGVNEQINLHGSAKDNTGIIEWAWKFGPNAWVITSKGDTSIIAPTTVQPYLCILRVTDEDYETDYDSLFVNILNVYTIIINSTNGGYTSHAGINNIKEGTALPITAYADTNNHYHFSQWSGDTTGINPSMTIQANKNMNITANFTLDNYNLNVINDGYGNTTPKGNISVSHSIATQISAIPLEFYNFSKWTIESGSASIADPNDRVTTITLNNGDVTIKANFQKKYFTRYLGGTGNDFGYSVSHTSNNGLILAGFSNSFSKNIDIYVVKQDRFGNILWDSTYGGAGDDYAYCIEQTEDNGFIIAGYTTTSFGAQNGDILLIKIDTHGKMEWYKTIGGSKVDGCYSVQQTDDKGFILAGYTASKGAGNFDAYLIKTDKFGNVDWDTTFGGSLFDDAKSVKQTKDKGYIVTGNTYSYGNAGDIFLIKTNSLGVATWVYNFGSDSLDGASSVIQKPDEGFLITGYTKSYGEGKYDVYILKTDKTGNFEGHKWFGGSTNDYAYSSYWTSDNEIIIAGYTESFSTGGAKDVYLIKTDEMLNLNWYRVFGGSKNDEAIQCIETKDDSYFIIGNTASFGKGNSNFYYIKTDKNGKIE